jgi:transcriptional regulator
VKVQSSSLLSLLNDAVNSIMFVRASWKPHSEQDVYAIVRESSWGQVISNGPGGPRVTNLPFVLDASRSPVVLTSHISRANDHALALQTATEPVLAVFEGPSSYITASWYPGRDMPPTIYYTAVHCYGHLVFQDKAALLESVEDLTARSEERFENGWKTSEVPPEAITRRLNSILGFELHVDRLEAKFKLGQDEPKRDALAVAHRLLASSNPADLALGALVLRYNESRP